MSRLIDADKLKRKCQKEATEAWKMNLTAKIESTMNQFIDFIDEMPTVDAEPVRHGKWILKGVREPLPRDYPPCYGEDEYDEDTHSIIVKHWFCSECDYDASDSFKPKDNYCPNCGAKMDGEVNNG